MSDDAKACRGCGAMVRWVTIAASNKRMPLNLTPSREGSVFLYDSRWQVVSRNVLPPPGVSLYVSHFATCANARTFRGKARR